MKLWFVIQWGNKDDGPNGWDTQCIVTAADMKQAIEKAQLHFTQFGNPLDPYRGGKADAINLMGEDGRPDGEPQLVVRIWVAFGDNMMHNPAWFRHPETDEWLDQKTMYGE